MKPIVLVLLATCASVHAADLGVIGPSYEIGEPHLLKMIEQRLQTMERSGELKRLEQKAKARGIAAITQPPPIAGLRATQTARTFYLDPSFTLERNLFDGQGHLLFPAGIRKNPLDVISLSKRLLFFDARDPRQVARARELMAHSPTPVKPILTAGSYLDLMRSWQVPVYYDQRGLLTRRFGIAQVPALVSQEGQRLRVDELELRP